MSQTSNPYGLSLFEYKGSNFSGTQAQYLINPTASVFGIPANSVGGATDQTGFTSVVGTFSSPLFGLCAGDLVTFGPSSSSVVGDKTGIPSSTSWTIPIASTGYIVGANSLYVGGTYINYPRAILGVFGGVQYQNPQNQNVRGLYWPNLTSVATGTFPIATVNDLADCIFQVQCGGSLGATTALAQQNIGKLFGFSNNCSGNPSSGQSQLFLDTTSPLLVGSVSPYVTSTTPTQTFPFRLIGLAPIQGNSWTDPYPDVLVMINNHMWKPGQPA